MIQQLTGLVKRVCNACVLIYGLRIAILLYLVFVPKNYIHLNNDASAELHKEVTAFHFLPFFGLVVLWPEGYLVTIRHGNYIFNRQIDLVTDLPLENLDSLISPDGILVTGVDEDRVAKNIVFFPTEDHNQ
jgi:hypothetical protein